MNWFRSLADLDNTYSEGETTLFIELQNRHRTTYMSSHKGITLNYEVDGVHGCEPDFLWDNYAVFLDGTPHKTSYREKKDALIKTALEKKGFIVDRFDYRGKLSKKKANEIADAIEKRLEKL